VGFEDAPTAESAAARGAIVDLVPETLPHAST
jgi:hypothetical protein